MQAWSFLYLLVRGPIQEFSWSQVLLLCLLGQHLIQQIPLKTQEKLAIQHD